MTQNNKFQLVLKEQYETVPVSNMEKFKAYQNLYNQICIKIEALLLKEKEGVRNIEEMFF